MSKIPTSRSASAASIQSGKTVDQDSPEFKGKPLIVDIFGTWCPNCHDEAPVLEKLYQQYRDQGLQIVGLAYEYIDDTQRNLKQIANLSREVRHYLSAAAGRNHRPGTDRQDAAATGGLRRVSDVDLHRPHRTCESDSRRFHRPIDGREVSGSAAADGRAHAADCGEVMFRVGAGVGFDSPSESPATSTRNAVRIRELSLRARWRARNLFSVARNDCRSLAALGMTIFYCRHGWRPSRNSHATRWLHRLESHIDLFFMLRGTGRGLPLY